MIDMRRVLMRSLALEAAADVFWEMYADRLPFQVGGMEVAAIPLISAILLRSISRGTPVNGFIVRKERKTYGAGNRIEGELSTDPIVLVDDTMNSGRSLEKVLSIMESEGRACQSAFVLIDFRSNKSLRWREKRGIMIDAVFKLADLGLATSKAAKPKPMASFTNVWSFRSPHGNFFHRVPKSFPVVHEGRVYLGSDSGVFWCLNSSTGDVIWKFLAKSRGYKNLWSTPAIHDRSVFFGSYDGNVYCLDTQTGDEKWRFTEADWVGSSPAVAPDLGLIFIGLEHATQGKQGSIVALDLHTGVKVWEYVTQGYTHASPVYSVDHGVVACGSNENEMLLFDAKTGTLRWRFQTTEQGSIKHAPAFDLKRGHLITGCMNGWIYILDIKSGTEVWSVKTGNSIYTIPKVLDDIAYAGSTDKHMYILDLEGRTVSKKIWVGAKIFSPATLLANRVYFGTCGGVVYEMDRKEVCGMHQLPDAITNSIAYDPESHLYFALTYMNELFAFQREEPSI